MCGERGTVGFRVQYLISLIVKRVSKYDIDATGTAITGRFYWKAWAWQGRANTTFLLTAGRDSRYEQVRTPRTGIHPSESLLSLAHYLLLWLYNRVRCFTITLAANLSRIYTPSPPSHTIHPNAHGNMALTTPRPFCLSPSSSVTPYKHSHHYTLASWDWRTGCSRWNTSHSRVLGFPSIPFPSHPVVVVYFPGSCSRG
jgi:hypothetical protein